MKSMLFKLAILALPAHAACALEAQVTKDVPAEPAAVWNEIGDFCGIASWHPAIAKCEASMVDGASLRTLTLQDGAQIVEQQVSRDDAQWSYSYTILNGPLPVADYQSTLSVVAKDHGSAIEWKGSFEASGAPDEDVVKLITGIYTVGVDSIAARVTK